MSRKKGATRSWTTYLAVWGPAGIVAVLGLILAFQFIGSPPPKTITIATGSEEGAYYHFGTAYAEFVARHGIELRIRKTSGSTENLRLLTGDGAGVDLAFVQSGTSSGEQGLQSLGSLYYEPLWIFHRRETPVGLLTDLRNCRIALGSNFSGTRAIASLLARENGIEPDADPTSSLSGAEAVEALKAGRVDAAFFVASPEAPLIRDLLADPDLALLSMSRAEAYARRNAFLSEVDVAEGMLDLENNIPPAKVHLISPTANLVIREDLHPALVDLVMQAASSVHGAGGMFEQPGEFPAPKSLEFPLSPEAERYYKKGPPLLQRALPFWIATLVDRLIFLLLPLLVLLIPLVKIVPPTLRWRIRRRVICWYREIGVLDRELDEDGAAAKAEAFLSEIDRIEEEVTRVDVPLGYADQLYNLRLHIDLVRRKIGTAAAESSVTRRSAQGGS